MVLRTLAFSTLTLSLLVSLAGCDTEPVADSQDDFQPDVLELRGDDAPLSLAQGDDFEEIVPGRCVFMSSYDVTVRASPGETAEAVVALNNICDEDYPIRGIQLLDLNDAFALANPLPDVIPAGGRAYIYVDFRAHSDIIHLGEVMVVTDDDKNGVQIATLYGIVPPEDGYRSGAAPTADAGANVVTVTTGGSASLDGSGSSDPEGDTLTYSWTFKSVPGGSSVNNSSIASQTSQSTSFTTDVDGTYRVRFVVSDGTSTDKDFTNRVASVSGTNSAPVADAGGRQHVEPPDSVTADGSGSSDSDGDTLSYTWFMHSTPGGSALTDDDISGASSSSATFTGDVEGDYVLKLRVSDGTEYGRDYANIKWSTNTAPVADGGANHTISLGDTVELDASASYDPDNDPITYAWSFRSVPAKSAQTKEDIVNRTGKYAELTPDVVGTYEVRCSVDDGFTVDADFIYVTVE
jgi:hypothetical protein